MLAIFSSAICVCPLQTSSPSAEKKLVWRSVTFAIVKFNDEAPKSWNIYHTEKKGLLLVQLWKRYLLVDPKEQEAYEIDPQTPFVDIAEGMRKRPQGEAAPLPAAQPTTGGTPQGTVLVLDPPDGGRRVVIDTKFTSILASGRFRDRCQMS